MVEKYQKNQNNECWRNTRKNQNNECWRNTRNNCQLYCILLYTTVYYISKVLTYRDIIHVTNI